MTILDERAGYKPLDFGADGDGITGSVDRDGRIIALNSYHPLHGYVTLTAAAPFSESERYHQMAVRAYRAHLVQLHGFGLDFRQPVIRREISLLEDAIPHIRLMFEGGASAEITTFACDGGVIQTWRAEGTTPSWSGAISLQRCAYTQLTEGGPLPAPPLELRLQSRDGLLILENPALGWAVAITGIPAALKQVYSATGWLDLHVHDDVTQPVQVYGFGPDADGAAKNALRLAQRDAGVCLERALARWRERWRGVAADPLLRRGLADGLMMAVPVGEGICILTDHMLLPLSWNRDAYYVARALLSWHPEMADLVRQHLIWMFEQTDRVNGAWARCYLANGKIKDGAFQLDQQLYPLLELAEYVLDTHDQTTYERLKPYLVPLLDGLNRRQLPGRMLFPTDETPADDPIALPYHLSSHVLFWRVARLLHQLGIESMGALADLMHSEIDRTFIAYHGGERLYAYASDGQQKYHFYHDANDIPLVLMPSWGLVSATDPVWRATVAFAFSDQNPGAFDGHLGSVHTRAAWPLGDVQELIVARELGNTAREQQVRSRLARIVQWDGALPEAYDLATGDVVSRHWFAWPNAALACIDRNAF